MQTVRKYSKKRRAILDALRSTNEHPSAEQLYALLKPEYPDLSLGTVYRNLSLFKEDGVAISVGTVNGQERFDGFTEPHAHFICTSCGSILDLLLSAAELESLRGLCERNAHEMREVSLSFSGVCERCRRAAKNAG